MREKRALTSCRADSQTVRGLQKRLNCLLMIQWFNDLNINIKLIYTLLVTYSNSTFQRWIRLVAQRHSNILCHESNKLIIIMRVIVLTGVMLALLLRPSLFSRVSFGLLSRSSAKTIQHKVKSQITNNKTISTQIKNSWAIVVSGDPQYCPNM